MSAVLVNAIAGAAAFGASPAATSASAPAGESIDAATFGFSPDATGQENTRALQRALDHAGTIVVSRAGRYAIAGTVFIGSHTTLIFGENVFLKKVQEPDAFTHVLLNKGALTKTWDEDITVRGLQIIVNGVDVRKFLVYGLHGQLAFFYAKNVRIERFRCLDLGKWQYGIHVCTFEDLTVDDVIIKGDKDGVHLGRGKRFTIRNGTFQTYDDAVALNAQDYAVGNPELGWIEDGVVEDCRDLDAEKPVAYFCRILAGAWTDWHAGMEVQQSDTVVSSGRVYRVQAKPDGTVYKSMTAPTHKAGTEVLDGIPWGMVQEDVAYTAGVRNVTFRNITLEKPRIAFSIHFDENQYNRSYYPGARIPQQQHLTFENVRVMYDEKREFLDVGTPIDTISVSNSTLRDSRIFFHGVRGLSDYLHTSIDLSHCTFEHAGKWDLLVNTVPGKVVELRTSGSVHTGADFSAGAVPGGGKITIDSDLPGLAK